ncbi:hypothetical protein GCM10007301_42430 [Azorhizobium oxalatiphilum]|uniref:Uncharacterized protein n=1 Tax=Azorhizobium oxalatiphilum TaxID=980631 RepID=A0A917C8W8_9HYPH|nr:hypothetical protein [Azorhizobium oxalatiphilum]GGF77973.1 hypothetical protein GCM10007301_42430 [Azorhizobium oxalatiphilum]
MRNPGRLLAQTSPHVKRLALKVGIGATLSLGTLALAHMMPEDRLDSQVRIISSTEAPSFDFVPARHSAEVAGPNLPAEIAKTDTGKAETTQISVAATKAPLPAARPQVVLVSAKASDAVAYPTGVERFDHCQARCESRDPAVFGTPQPMPATAAATVPPPPPVEAAPRGPLQGTLHGAMAVLDGGKKMVDGALGGGKRMVDGALGTGKRAMDGALDGATATLVGVKEAMLGAITPDL